MEKQVTLIFTNSFDQTVDRLIRHIGTDRVFRFNLDRWREYRFSLIPGDFAIANPLGRTVRRADIAKFFWRKPLSRLRLHENRGASEREFYLEEEIFYVIREIRSQLAQDGKIVLIEPESTERTGKFLQMDIARRFFPVPAYEFFFDPQRSRVRRARVVKSLTSGRLDDRDFYLWTTRVDEAELDRSTPWFVQDFVEASLDVTVTFVRDEMWAFALDRSLFIERTVDWREEGPPVIAQWREHTLPPELVAAIKGYMAAVSLDYGRLDFLYDGRDYWFLEVNSNGEWGWLDPAGEVGILKKIAAEIHPDTSLHPIAGCGRFC